MEPLVECGPGGEVGSEAAEPGGEFGSRLDGAGFAEPEWLGCFALFAANAHAHETTCPLRSIVALVTIIGRLGVELNGSMSLAGRLTIGDVRRRQRIAELEQRLGELQAASERATELSAALDRTRAEAASRIAELEGRVAELESALAASENELDTALASARPEAERIRTEKAARQEAHDAVASRNANHEERLEELDAANARATQLERQLEETPTQITHFEAESNNVLAVTPSPASSGAERHADEHAEDLSHLLFVPGPMGYRLVAQDGPPPMPGSTLQFSEDDGTVSTLLVSKVGLAPLPGGSVACAYLVAAE